MNMHHFDWTQCAVDEAVTMRRKNFSASWIAHELSRMYGARITRSAVMGKLARIGEPFAGTLTDQQRQANERRRGLTRAKRLELLEAARASGTNVTTALLNELRTRRRIIKNQVTEVQEPVPAESEPLTAGTVSFLELQEDQCRWIPGKPAGEKTLYCGAAQIGGSSYCKYHFLESINPTTPWYERRRA